MSENIILDVDRLCVEFDTEGGRVRAVDGVGFQLKKGKTLGIAGESGCGKTITALSIIRLLPKPVSRIVQGRVMFQGRDLLALSKQEMQQIRGRKIAMIFQEPTTALDVTVQAEILDLIRTLKQESGMSVILITHDLGVIAENCDDVAVMYAGKIVENAGVRDLFHYPLHPYTKGLLGRFH